MNILTTGIPGLLVIEPKVWGDSRGYFVETYKQELLEAHTGKVNYIQDNESKSGYAVLRGLHYQKGDFAQSKLVRVVTGSVLDVVVDLRKSSPTFGKYYSLELNAESKRQLFVPRGLAHGFVVTSEEAIFVYKVDNVYSPENECCILYKDPAIGINWVVPEDELKLSPKDMQGLLLKDADLFD